MRESLEDIIARILHDHAVLVVNHEGRDGFGSFRITIEIQNAADLAEAVIKACEQDMRSTDPRHDWRRRVAA